MWIIDVSDCLCINGGGLVKVILVKVIIKSESCYFVVR